MKQLQRQLFELYFLFSFAIIVVGLSPYAFAQSNSTNGQGIINDLGRTLKESLKAEEKNILNYKERLDRRDREKIYLAAALNGYQLQLSTYGNLLLSAGVEISIFQKTRSEIKSSLLEIQKMIDETSPANETLTLERKNLEQQKQLVEKQIVELSKLNIKSNKDTITKEFEDTAKQLAKVISQKETYMSQLDELYKKRLKNLSETQQAFTTLETQFANAIEQLKTKNLFERNKEIFRFDAFKALKEDIVLLFQKIKSVAVPKFWITGVQKLWQSAGFIAISFALFLFGALFVLLRAKTSLSAIQNLDYVERLGNWHKITTRLLTLSIIPGGVALILFLYSRLKTMYLVAPTLQMISLLIFTFLAVNWINQVFGDAVAEIIGKETSRFYKKLCRTISIFILISLPIFYGLGRDSDLLVLFRVTGALWILVWSLLTWKGIKIKDFQKGHQDQRTFLIGLASKYLLVLISSAAIIFDMIGYGSLSIHWLISWAKTVVIIFWWTIFLNLIKEWDQYYKDKSNTERDEFLYDNYPVQWLMIRAGQLLWFVSLMVVILLAWGNQQTVLGKFYTVLASPLNIGSMKFSFLGFIYSALVILMTYAMTRMWKWLFQAKFLSRSGMAIGLQDSITTITIYGIWLFGILLSLHVFGLNTASLAVAFGALGIGLGFGLQNIFNNFISGIILLFERPIQVGDDIEMNGKWAQVKKINVRSTVVQTYDNASLIIPNADLISNQVTNWSFKDKRIRRNIAVGVAYGSDIDLTRETLLEIAKNTKKVLRNPKPDVVFRDFGDSALIFQLRVWTDIDNMLIVETDIRFKIDKLFKERKIEISFPQRDLHIRSIKGLSKTDQIKKDEIENSISESEDSDQLK